MAKSLTPIPAGFHAVTPHLTVIGAEQYLDFLKRAFGAEQINVSPGPGGKIIHATVRIGDSMVMFSDDFAAEFGMPPLAQGRMPFMLHLYVADADATWATAISAGCEITMPITDAFWGSRYGHLRDPFGVGWAIATQQEDVSEEEQQKRAAEFFGGHQ